MEEAGLRWRDIEARLVLWIVLIPEGSLSSFMMVLTEDTPMNDAFHKLRQDWERSTELRCPVFDTPMY